MSRLTITLDDDLHRALKEMAARQGRSIDSVIEESLRGVQNRERARMLVAKVSQQSPLNADQAMAVALEESRSRNASAAGDAERGLDLLDKLDEAVPKGT